MLYLVGNETRRQQPKIYLNFIQIYAFIFPLMSRGSQPEALPSVFSCGEYRKDLLLALQDGIKDFMHVILI